jgi:transposase
MIAAGTKRIDLDMKELKEYLDQARSVVGEEGYGKLTAALETLAYLTDVVGDKDTTISKLRKILFGASTEKTRNVVGQATGNAGSAAAGGSESGSSRAPVGDTSGESSLEKAKGHGRNGAAAFTGADRVHIEHGSLKPGQRCPKCEKGKIYRCKEPALLVRIKGQAPLQATVYALERWRCNLCGEVFTAEAPEGVGPARWDEAAASMVGLLKYGTGVPFYRLEQLQKSLGIPLPASTQWEMVKEAAAAAEPAWEELIRQAAQGEVFHNDDTTAVILEAIRERRRREHAQSPGDAGDPGERTGTFTSGIVSIVQGRKIALFFTGHQHAGENLRDVLLKRAAGLEPPIQMCDGLARNEPDLPEELEVILSNCNAHSRRQFVDVASRFPEECRHVLEVFRDVYRNDAVASRKGMTPDERLAFHKSESGPRMEDLRRWMAEQLDGKKVEPNSGLGEAILYTQKRWDRLTRFLQVPGVPLDNNAAERILKKAILSRKNSYFYKTAKGAHVGDMFMSLIHTTELMNANPFDYLTELQKHARDVAGSPAEWMPWNYRQRIDQACIGPVGV